MSKWRESMSKWRDEMGYGVHHIYFTLWGGHPGAFNERVWERYPNRNAPRGGTLADIRTPFHDSYID